MVAGYDANCLVDGMEELYQIAHFWVVMAQIGSVLFFTCVIFLTIWCLFAILERPYSRNKKAIWIISLFIFWPVSPLLYGLLNVKKRWNKLWIILLTLPILIFSYKLTHDFVIVSKRVDGITAYNNLIRNYYWDFIFLFQHYPHYRDLLKGVDLSELNTRQRCDLKNFVNSITPLYPYIGMIVEGPGLEEADRAMLLKEFKNIIVDKKITKKDYEYLMLQDQKIMSQPKYACPPNQCVKW